VKWEFSTRGWYISGYISRVDYGINKIRPQECSLPVARVVAIAVASAGVFYVATLIINSTFTTKVLLAAAGAIVTFLFLKALDVEKKANSSNNKALIPEKTHQTTPDERIKERIHTMSEKVRHFLGSKYQTDEVDSMKIYVNFQHNEQKGHQECIIDFNNQNQQIPVIQPTQSIVSEKENSTQLIPKSNDLVIQKTNSLLTTLVKDLPKDIIELTNINVHVLTKTKLGQMDHVYCSEARQLKKDSFEGTYSAGKGSINKGCENRYIELMFEEMGLKGSPQINEQGQFIASVQK
jgi:hypothetical protein